MSLEAKNVLVTGASRGIGQAIARSFAETGARVVGTATTEAGAQAIQDALASTDGLGVCLDVSVPESIANVFKLLLKQQRSPEIVVNNAGITRDNLLARMREDDWQQVLDT